MASNKTYLISDILSTYATHRSLQQVEPDDAVSVMVANVVFSWIDGFRLRLLARLFSMSEF